MFCFFSFVFLGLKQAPASDGVRANAFSLAVTVQRE